MVVTEEEEEPEEMECFFCGAVLMKRTTISLVNKDTGEEYCWTYICKDCKRDRVYERRKEVSKTEEISRKRIDS